MKIKLQNGGCASEDSIRALESQLGCKLSESFKEFVRTQDGAKPETNMFKIGDKNESGVAGFIPVEEIAEQRAHIEGFPQDKAYPVAWDDCGNCVFVDEARDGAVFFWDHELPEGTTQLAPNFGSFLDLLEPFDISTVKLKPGQVKRVWVDPEFLKRLTKK
jgi:hypothetical protein